MRQCIANTVTAVIRSEIQTQVLPALTRVEVALRTVLTRLRLPDASPDAPPAAVPKSLLDHIVTQLHRSGCKTMTGVQNLISKHRSGDGGAGGAGGAEVDKSFTFATLIAVPPPPLPSSPVSGGSAGEFTFAKPITVSPPFVFDGATSVVSDSDKAGNFDQESVDAYLKEDTVSGLVSQTEAPLSKRRKTSKKLPRMTCAWTDVMQRATEELNDERCTRCPGCQRLAAGSLIRPGTWANCAKLTGFVHERYIAARSAIGVLPTYEGAVGK